MALTYEPIATQTLGSTTATITFSSIPATYTDLKLIVGNINPTVGYYMIYRFNGDTGTNYSYATLDGDGVNTTTSNGINSNGFFGMARVQMSSGIIYLDILDIFQYKNTGLFKTLLEQAAGAHSAAGGLTTQEVGLWRSTAAINSISITTSNGSFLSGTTATLYGIQAA